MLYEEDITTFHCLLESREDYKAQRRGNRHLYMILHISCQATELHNAHEMENPFLLFVDIQKVIFCLFRAAGSHSLTPCE